MLAAQAHSFTQQARLAITLAWVAGYTNIITLLACGTATSHVSGTASQLGRFAAERAWNPATFVFWLLATFVLGAAASSLLTELGHRRAWASVYVLPVAVEALLLGVFALGVEWHDHGFIESGWPLWWMTGVASLAMGLQNATITRISSGVVRTTHVTGVLTDLGLEAVQYVWWRVDRRREVPHPPVARVHSIQTHPTGRRLVLLASIVGSFALGAGLGTLAYETIPAFAMFPPVAFLVWIIYLDLTRPIAHIAPSALASDEGYQLPDGIAVYHLRKDRGRSGPSHRLPDMLAWSDRLPHTTRVVILDLADITRLDANAALELRALVLRFTAQGRRLIVSGLDAGQYEHLRRAGASDTLDPTNVCPDLELAIARGLTLLDAPRA